MIDPQGNAAHQSLFLHEVQSPQHAVIFLGDTGSLKDDILQFLLAVCCIQEEHRYKEHALISGLQIFQQPFCLTAIRHKI